MKTIRCKVVLKRLRDAKQIPWFYIGCGPSEVDYGANTITFHYGGKFVEVWKLFTDGSYAYGGGGQLLSLTVPDDWEPWPATPPGESTRTGLGFFLDDEGHEIEGSSY